MFEFNCKSGHTQVILNKIKRCICKSNSIFFVTFVTFFVTFVLKINKEKFAVPERKLPLFNFISQILKNIEHIYHCLKSVQTRSFFWSVFSCIRSEYDLYDWKLDLLSKIYGVFSPNTGKNSIFGRFSRSVSKKDSPAPRAKVTTIFRL